MLIRLDRICATRYQVAQLLGMQQTIWIAIFGHEIEVEQGSLVTSCILLATWELFIYP